MAPSRPTRPVKSLETGKGGNVSCVVLLRVDLGRLMYTRKSYLGVEKVLSENDIRLNSFQFQTPLKFLGSGQEGVVNVLTVFRDKQVPTPLLNGIGSSVPVVTDIVTKGQNRYNWGPQSIKNRPPSPLIGYVTSYKSSVIYGHRVCRVEVRTVSFDRDLQRFPDSLFWWRLTLEDQTLTSSSRRWHTFLGYT